MEKQIDKKQPHYVERVNFTSSEENLEEIQSQKYGEAFLDYRRRYFHSLNSDKHGQWPDFAHTLTLEFVNRCNLSCSMCYIANHSFSKSSLSLESVKNLIDEIAVKGKTGLLLGVGSEGLLFKEVRETISYAKEAGIMDIILMTNGTLLTQELSEFLVQQEVSRVCISIDAATSETYEKVRGKDQLQKVEKNVRTLVETREKNGKLLPIVRLSFCVLDENKIEQTAFRDKWRGIVDYIDFQKVNDFSYVGKEDEVVLQSNNDSPNQKPFCSKPFGYLNVWSNGDISPCCTFYGKSLNFGNIKKDTLADVYNGDKLSDLRDQFLGKKELNQVCKVCLSQRENLIGDEVWSEG